MNQCQQSEKSIYDNTSFHDSQKKYLQNSNQQEQNIKNEQNKQELKKSENEAEDEIICNKTTNQCIYNQINQIQNDQTFYYSKLKETEDFCSTNKYGMETLSRCKKINETSNFEQNEQNEHIDCILQNQYSTVDFNFDRLLNKCAIIKENTGVKRLFEKECKILKQLKGSNITQDTISVNKDNTKFQQIAGKINLKSENEAEDEIICNKTTSQYIYNQIKQTQDVKKFYDSKLIEPGDFCSTNQYGMETLRRCKKVNEASKFEYNKQHEHIDCIFKNQYSIVDLNFDRLLNKFVITKENTGVQRFFEKECKILEQLKGSNITLDIISVNKDYSKFQQIAGKINLYYLKKKISDAKLFQTYYLILLDKLQRMHEKGIAHSDIKPQNIVISYQNEPYFIDFGGSINLSREMDYQFYLNQYTPSFNLNMSLGKQFKDKEEIKLCDSTQLSITFLYLLCENTIQLQLFNSKNYNELIQDLLSLNKELTLSIISNILNQVDPSINIIQIRANEQSSINQSVGYYFGIGEIQSLGN